MNTSSKKLRDKRIKWMVHMALAMGVTAALETTLVFGADGSGTGGDGNVTASAPVPVNPDVAPSDINFLDGAFVAGISSMAGSAKNPAAPGGMTSYGANYGPVDGNDSSGDAGVLQLGFRGHALRLTGSGGLMVGNGSSTVDIGLGNFKSMGGTSTSLSFLGGAVAGTYRPQNGCSAYGLGGVNLDLNIHSNSPQLNTGSTALTGDAGLICVVGKAIFTLGPELEVFVNQQGTGVGAGWHGRLGTRSLFVDASGGVRTAPLRGDIYEHTPTETYSKLSADWTIHDALTLGVQVSQTSDKDAMNNTSIRDSNNTTVGAFVGGSFKAL